MIISIEVNRIVDIDLVNELIAKLELKKTKFSDEIVKLIDDIEENESKRCSEQYCEYVSIENIEKSNYESVRKEAMENLDYEIIYRDTIKKLEYFLMRFMENKSKSKLANEKLVFLSVKRKWNEHLEKWIR